MYTIPCLIYIVAAAQQASEQRDNDASSSDSDSDEEAGDESGDEYKVPRHEFWMNVR